MTTVADLYTQVLGRAPDAGGLAYWESLFGNNVDPTEAATFKSVAQQTEPTAVAANLWNQVDPSSALSAQMVAATPTAAGSTMPTTVEDVYKTFYGTVDPAGAAYWKSQFGGNAIDPQQASLMINEIGKNSPNIDTGLTVEQAFKNYLGGNTDQAGINFWKQQFGNGPLTVSQLSQLTNTQSGINTDTGSGGLFGTGIGPDISWTSIRDPLEAAGVVAGNYLLPGSSLVTGQLVSEGAKKDLATPVGMLANIAAGAAGGYAGNTANYGKLADAAGLTSNADALAADNIDVGGGWNPATGTGDAATAAAAAATGVTSSAATPHLFTPSGMDVNAGVPLSTATPTTTTTTLADTIKNLTPSQISTLTKAGINIAGLLAGGAAIKGITGALTPSTSGLSLNPQNRAGISSGSAQYSPEYYQAIQSKYNQLMPQQPRDVTTELKNWYETKYAPTATITPKVI